MKHIFRIIKLALLSFMLMGCTPAKVDPISGLFLCTNNNESYYMWEFAGSTINTYSESSDYMDLLDSFDYTIKNGKHWVNVGGKDTQIKQTDDSLTIGTNGFKCVMMKY
jgi:hypothetical protein